MFSFRSTAWLTLAFCCACSGPENPEDHGKETADGFEVSKRLAGKDVTTVMHGPWQERKIARPIAAGELASESLRRVEYLEEDGAAGFAPRSTAPVDAAPGMEAPREHLDEMAAPQGGAPLRAGSTDDNAEFEAYLKYLADQRANGTMQHAIDLDVADRLLPRVLDREGRPLPGARITVLDEANDVIAYRGTSYGDGRFPFYPRMLDVAALTAQDESKSPEEFLVEVRWRETSRRFQWDGRAETDFQLDVAQDPTVRLDVVFVIDTTGSMGDEIARIKASLLAMTQKLRSLAKEFDLRYGAVLYRDLGDEYVTRSHAFTSDIEAFDQALQGVQAGGGGDTPESLNQGLAVCVSDMAWRTDAARVAFLIADAPPHLDYEDDVAYDRSLREAVAKGIRMHAVAASGLDDTGSLVFRQIAQFTRGKFVFIEYGSTASTAADHGVTGAVKSNNLDDILFEQLRDEIANYGRG